MKLWLSSLMQTANWFRPAVLATMLSALTATAMAAFAMVIIPSPGNAAGDKYGCPADEAQLIDKREGTQNGVVSYNYESRVEAYTSTAKRYIWCINNTSKYFVAEFRWGADPDLKKDYRYFGGFIEPGKTTPAIRTDSSDIKRALRYIGVRRLDSGHWKTIKAETIFNSHVGWLRERKEFVSASMIKRVQFRAPLSSIDVTKISENAAEFSAFLRKVGGLNFENAIIATIPTSAKVANQIDAGTYAKYDSRDFVRAWVRLVNDIRLVKDKPYSVYYFVVEPEDLNDLDRVGEAISSVHAELTLEPVTQPVSNVTVPKQLFVRAEASKINKKVIFSEPAEHLSYITALLSFGSLKNKSPFVSMPVKLLVSRSTR